MTRSRARRDGEAPPRRHPLLDLADEIESGAVEIRRDPGRPPVVSLRRLVLARWRRLTRLCMGELEL